MDEGCEVYWEHCYDREQELSAVQHFYNALIDDGPEVFASEYQQEPLADESRADSVRPADLVSHAINVPAWMVPAGCGTLTAFVDVQEACLYWVVCAWGSQLRGHVVAYGTYPDQNRAYFALRDVERTLRLAAGNAPLADAMHQGLEVVAGEILGREFHSEDSDAVHRVALMLVDANWAQTADVTRDFARRSKHGTRLMPCHGRYVGASRRTLSDAKAEPGERVGAHWRTSTIKKSRHILFDTNYWKSLVIGRMKLGAADPMAFTFHDGRHEMLFDHIASEFPTRVENKATGRTVDEWQLIPGRDNHWLDGVVGAAVAASVVGVSAVGAESRPQVRKRITAEEMAARRAQLFEQIRSRQGA
jgi:phage terminase large subunit GpA-like protein